MLASYNTLIFSMEHLIPEQQKKLDDALLGAAMGNNAQEVISLLNQGADINHADTNGDTALIRAARNGYIEIVRILIEHRANVNRADGYGLTALIEAADRGYGEVVNVLIEAGADINHTSNHGFAALGHAVLRDHTEIVRLLLLNNASVSDNKVIRTRMLKLLKAYDVSPLAIAIITGDRDTITRILEERPTKKVKHEGSLLAPPLCPSSEDLDDFSMRPLHWAVARNDEQTVNALLECNVNVNVRDQDGNTPLHYAARNGDSNILTALLNHGANVNAVNNNGDTPLHYAARAGHLGAVRTLLDHNARTNLFNRQHALAWTLAIQNNHPEVARLLEGYAGQVAFGRVTRAGRQTGQFEWAPTGIPLPPEIAALVAQYVMAPGAPAAPASSEPSV